MGVLRVRTESLDLRQALGISLLLGGVLGGGPNRLHLVNALLHRLELRMLGNVPRVNLGRLGGKLQPVAFQHLGGEVPLLLGGALSHLDMLVHYSLEELNRVDIRVRSENLLVGGEQAIPRGMALLVHLNPAGDIGFPGVDVFPDFGVQASPMGFHFLLPRFWHGVEGGSSGGRAVGSILRGGGGIRIGGLVYGGFFPRVSAKTQVAGNLRSVSRGVHSIQRGIVFFVHD